MDQKRVAVGRRAPAELADLSPAFAFLDLELKLSLLDFHHGAFAFPHDLSSRRRTELDMGFNPVCFRLPPGPVHALIAASRLLSTRWILA